MTNHPQNKGEVIIAPALAIGLALFSYFLFTAGDTMAKWLQGGYHPAQIIVTINLVGLLVMSGIAVHTRGIKQAFQSKKWPLHLARGVVIGTSTMLVFYALRHMPLSDFYSIVFLNPIWVALLSRILLAEKIPPSRIVAIIIGFLGVLVIAGPEFATLNLGFLAALGVSFLGACGALLARHIGGDEAPATFGIATHTVMVTFNIPAAIGHYTAPSFTDAGLMVLYGCMIAGAMTGISYVFARSRSVSQVAPLQYTQMLWGILLGWLVFNNIPSERTLAGSLLVIAAGFYVMRSLHRGRLMNR
ncbi:MAG: DMT family transporter [Alphaproteobacteria bacterium]|nr:DMT family transporter [Alphaproteobacteria bacterium]